MTTRPDIEQMDFGPLVELTKQAMADHTTQHGNDVYGQMSKVEDAVLAVVWDRITAALEDPADDMPRYPLMSDPLLGGAILAYTGQTKGGPSLRDGILTALAEGHTAEAVEGFVSRCLWEVALDKAGLADLPAFHKND